MSPGLFALYTLTARSWLHKLSQTIGVWLELGVVTTLAGNITYGFIASTRHVILIKKFTISKNTILSAQIQSIDEDKILRIDEWWRARVWLNSPLRCMIMPLSAMLRNNWFENLQFVLMRHDASKWADCVAAHYYGWIWSRQVLTPGHPGRVLFSLDCNTPELNVAAPCWCNLDVSWMLHRLS